MAELITLQAPAPREIATTPAPECACGCGAWSGCWADVNWLPPGVPAPRKATNPMTTSTLDRPTARPATPKQTAFIRSLLAERAGDEKAEAIREALNAARETPGALTTKVASSTIEALLAIPKTVSRAPERTTTDGRPYVTVADGRYAVDFEGQLRFFHVRTPDEGRWAGYTFVDEQAGGETYPVKARARREAVLAAIAADGDALARYGQEIGACGVCGRTLTDAESRARGIGPVCIENL